MRSRGGPPPEVEHDGDELDALCAPDLLRDDRALEAVRVWMHDHGPLRAGLGISVVPRPRTGSPRGKPLCGLCARGHGAGGETVRGRRGLRSLTALGAAVGLVILLGGAYIVLSVAHLFGWFLWIRLP